MEDERNLPFGWMAKHSCPMNRRTKRREECMEDYIELSTLPKTWIFDLDGTLLKHNGYKIDGKDSLLPGVKEYISGIPEEDKIIIITSRSEEDKELTLCFLDENQIRYDEILFQMPVGERIIVNDRKPSGLNMAVALNVERDLFLLPQVVRRK